MEVWVKATIKGVEEKIHSYVEEGDGINLSSSNFVKKMHCYTVCVQGFLSPCTSGNSVESLGIVL